MPPKVAQMIKEQEVLKEFEELAYQHIDYLITMKKRLAIIENDIKMFKKKFMVKLELLQKRGLEVIEDDR